MVLYEANSSNDKLWIVMKDNDYDQPNKPYKKNLELATKVLWQFINF